MCISYVYTYLIKLAKSFSGKRYIMKCVITGRGTNVTPALKNAVEEKLGKLEHYFTPETEVHVTLKVEKNKRDEDRQRIEVTVPVKGHIIRAEQVSDDMYVSIDLVEDIIERQLRKYKTKLINSKQSAVHFTSEFMETNEEDYEDDEVKILRTKKFAVKPMYPEEACIQMELLNHSFYVFRNANTDELNVVYKRKGDTYGLIEPEF